MGNIHRFLIGGLFSVNIKDFKLQITRPEVNISKVFYFKEILNMLERYCH